jgi:transposase
MVPSFRSASEGGGPVEEETRKTAIQRHLKGEDPKAIYGDLKRSKKWFFKWWRRFKTGQLDWYKDRPKAPLRRPTKTQEAERQLIASIRRRLDSERFAQTGVSAIKWELTKLGLNFPSDSTINRVLKEEGLVKKNLVSPEGCRVSLFHRGTGLQQHSPSGPDRAAVHKRRWQVLLIQLDRPL